MLDQCTKNALNRGGVRSQVIGFYANLKLFFYFILKEPLRYITPLFSAPVKRQTSTNFLAKKLYWFLTFIEGAKNVVSFSNRLLRFKRNSHTIRIESLFRIRIELTGTVAELCERTSRSSIIPSQECCV